MSTFHLGRLPIGKAFGGDHSNGFERQPNAESTFSNIFSRVVLANIKELQEHYFDSLFVSKFLCFRNQIDPIIKQSEHTVSPNFKKKWHAREEEELQFNLQACVSEKMEMMC